MLMKKLVQPSMIFPIPQEQWIQPSLVEPWKIHILLHVLPRTVLLIKWWVVIHKFLGFTLLGSTSLSKKLSKNVLGSSTGTILHYKQHSTFHMPQGSWFPSVHIYPSPSNWCWSSGDILKYCSLCITPKKHHPLCCMISFSLPPPELQHS